jgi:uncharacterized protein (DUF2384 family)
MCELDEVGTIQVWSQIQIHGEEGGHEMMIMCSTWKRRKRKTKFDGDQGKGIARFLVLVIKTP